MNRGNWIATVASQLRELGLLSEEFFSSEKEHSSKPTKSLNTPKDNIISILTRDTKNASTQIFNDEYIPLLANILFDTDRIKIEKYISNLKQKATKEQIQEYINVITDPDIKKIFAKLQDTKELNNASDILKNNTSASLNLYAILSASDDNNSAEYVNIPIVLEKNFQKLRNNLYKHFNNTNRSALNYWLNFMFINNFDGKNITFFMPSILKQIEDDLIDESNKIVKTHPIAIFIASIIDDLNNKDIYIEYDLDHIDFIKSNWSTQNISGYRATINNFLRKNDINVSPIPSYYDMSYNWFDNKFWSKANKLKLIIMQNIYSKRIFWLKLYKSDYWFLYAYLNHLVRAQGKRAFVISAKNLWKLYGSDFNPSNTSKIKRSEILEKNSDIIVVEDADYFYDRAEKTRDRLKWLWRTVILLWNQSSSFDNPFGDLCQTSMIYDLPISSKKSQKEIFAKIYNNQLSSLFKITLSPNTLEVLPIMIWSINRNYWNIKAIFDKVSIDQEKIKEYIWKDMILELWDSYHKALSTQDIWEIVLFLKIYGNWFELSIDDIDDCMRSFYWKEHVAEWWYSEEMSSLVYNILTKPYSSDILWIPLAIQNSSDTKKLVKDKYKVDKLDTNSSLQEIITDNSMLLEFVDILNKKIIKKYYNTTWDL